MHTFAETPDELFKEISRHDEALKPGREVYKNFNDEYVGGQAGFGIKGKRPSNYIYEMVEGEGSTLAPEQIRNRVTAKLTPQAFDALKVTLTLDAAMKEMKLAETINEAQLEAQFAQITVARISQKTGPRMVELDGEEVPSVESVVDLVSFEDLVLDTEAKSWKTRRFVADRVEVSRRAAIANKTFGRDPADYAQPMFNGQKPEPAPEGIAVMTRAEAAAWFQAAVDKQKKQSSVGANRVRTLGSRGIGGAGEDDDVVTLWHVAIYDHGCVYIAYIPDDDSQPEKFLSYEKYRHHPDGPYVALKFGDIRGNVLGMPGVAAIADLHDAARQLSNKMVKQLMELMVTLVYSEGAHAVAMRVHKNKGDGPVRVRDVKKLATMMWGGVPREWVEGKKLLDEEFSNIGGGTRLMSGTQGSEDPTASQAMQRQGNAERRRHKRQGKIRAFLREISEKLAYQAIFNNPVGKRTVDMPLGGGVSIPVDVNPAEMQADALSFQYEIEPFAYAGADPLTQRNGVMQFLDLYFTKLLPGILQGAIKPEAAAEIGRVHFGIDNVEELLGNLPSLVQSAAQQMQEAQQPVAGPSGQPPPAAPAQSGGGGGGGGGYRKPVNAMQGQMGKRGAMAGAA